MKKILKHTTNTIIYLFAFIAIILLALSLLGIKPYITVSGSMEPSIQTGSVCFVNLNAKYEDVQINDVIAFKAGGTLVTHRALNFAKNGIETKGDNNESPDSIITNESNFVGQTLFSIPYIGYIIMFLKSPFGLYIAIAIAVILLFFNISDIIQQKKKQKTSKMNNIKTEELIVFDSISNDINHN